MKKILMGGIIALSGLFISPIEINAEIQSSQTTLTQRRVVFRKPQNLRCSKTKEEIKFKTDGSFTLLQDGVKIAEGTYGISGNYVILYFDGGDEFHCRISKNNAGDIISLTFQGDLYLPMR